MGPEQLRGPAARWGQRKSGRLAFLPVGRWPGYQAWVRAQCGQPTEVVTSASKA
jgi:hypothetical protein